jgi:NADH:ubiquinone oxidoreductase subunit H
MKRFISAFLLALLLIIFLVLLFKPFYDEVVKNGWKGFLIASISYLIMGVIFYLLIKLFNWCLSVWE